MDFVPLKSGQLFLFSLSSNLGYSKAVVSGLAIADELVCTGSVLNCGI